MTNPLDINFPNVGLNAYLPPLDAARSRTFTLDTGEKVPSSRIFVEYTSFLEKSRQTRRVDSSNDEGNLQQYLASKLNSHIS